MDMHVKPQRGVLSAGQRKALAALPDLRESKFPQVRASIPSASYTDLRRFVDEMTHVFRKWPVIAAPSALLSASSSYAAVELVGMPVLLTRTKEGLVNAFANVCRHRGAKLCSSTDPVEAVRLVCPYHAWTYRLDGTLFSVPRQETFPGIDRGEFGLVRLPVVESGGLIWVGVDPKADTDFSSVRGEIEEDLDALGLGNMTLFRKTTFLIRANWKLVMDTMLDSYHVTRLHKDSLAKFFVDAENIVDTIGPHIRAAAARGNFDRSIPVDDFSAARKIMVFAYTLFPNGIIVVSPYFISVGVLRPIASDRSEVDYYMLIDQPPADDVEKSKLQRSFDLMETAFGKEDYWAAELCDAGLRSGALEFVQLGGMEVQITLFHNAVNTCLGLDTDPPPSAGAKRDD
jgi:phenylpropionate dioxygenase-like ring-hydroxylating dioxygenase large terminal subunit